MQLEKCVCVCVCVRVCVCVCTRACSLTFCDHMREVTGAGVWMKPMGSYPSLMLRKNTVESLLCIYKKCTQCIVRITNTYVHYRHEVHRYVRRYKRTCVHCV